jgi:hypothetical protein
MALATFSGRLLWNRFMAIAAGIVEFKNETMWEDRMGTP